jgi:hypothetical protein
VSWNRNVSTSAASARRKKRNDAGDSRSKYGQSAAPLPIENATPLLGPSVGDVLDKFGMHRLASGGTVRGLIDEGPDPRLRTLMNHLYCDYDGQYPSVCAVKTVYSPASINLACANYRYSP